MTIAECLQWAVETLTSCSSSPKLDAELLLALVIGESRLFVLTNGSKKLDAGQMSALTDVLEERRRGVPLAYITKTKEFYGRDFDVSPAVLIPRPATELVVDRALAQLRQWNAPRRLRVLDMGTGSGNIAVTLAKELPTIDVVATDVDEHALMVAQQNARLHDAPISFLRSDLFGDFSSEWHGAFDGIVANLPYLSAEDSARVSEEPRGALTPEHNDAFFLIEKLLREAAVWLRPEKHFLIAEIGHDQGERALQCARSFCPSHKIQLYKDLEGWDRVLEIS